MKYFKQLFYDRNMIVSIISILMLIWVPYQLAAQDTPVDSESNATDPETEETDNSFEFSGDYTSVVFAEDNERTVLRGSAKIVSKTTQLFSDSIEVFGTDFRYANSIGNVVVVDTEQNYRLSAQELWFDREDEILRARGQAILEDYDNELVIKGEIIEFRNKEQLSEIQRGVRILGEDIIARSEYVRYNRETEVVEFSGLPVVEWKEDEYSAARIILDMDDDTVELQGQVYGKIQVDEDDDEPQQPTDSDAETDDDVVTEEEQEGEQPTDDSETAADDEAVVDEEQEGEPPVAESEEETDSETVTEDEQEGEQQPVESQEDTESEQQPIDAESVNVEIPEAETVENDGESTQNPSESEGIIENDETTSDSTTDQLQIPTNQDKSVDIIDNDIDGDQPQNAVPLLNIDTNIDIETRSNNAIIEDDTVSDTAPVTPATSSETTYDDIIDQPNNVDGKRQQQHDQPESIDALPQPPIEQLVEPTEDGAASPLPATEQPIPDSVNIERDQPSPTETDNSQLIETDDSINKNMPIIDESEESRSIEDTIEDSLINSQEDVQDSDVSTNTPLIDSPSEDIPTQNSSDDNDATNR